MSWMNCVHCKASAEQKKFIWNFSIVCWTVLSAMKDKTHSLFDLVLRSRGHFVSQRSPSLMGGHCDLGVLSLQYIFIGPDWETPLLCDQWESRRLKFPKFWVGLGKSNNRPFWIPQGGCVNLHLWPLCSVMILAGCWCEPPIMAFLQCHAASNIWC